MNQELLKLIDKMREIFNYNSAQDEINNERLKASKKNISFSPKKECRYCCSNHINKNGRAKNGIQRYICKDCKRTFSDVTGLPISYTKKPIDIWLKYMICIKSGATLREIAKILDINLSTSFQWRHKILSVIGTQIMKDKLAGDIEIGEIKLEESFKGSRGLIKSKRSKITILNCKDTLDKKYMKPITKESINKEILKKHIIPILSDEYNSLAPPRNFTYYFFFIENNLKISLAERNVDRFKKILKVNSVATNRLVNERGRAFKLFLKNFHNVASKYLSFYINWFVVFMIEDNLAFSLFKRFVLGEKQLRVEDFRGVKYTGNIHRDKRRDEEKVLRVVFG
ncbi:IS1/IS1595 family N-terminal zinc-binding domain-containing protein [Clostridium sp. UBA1652]|uniref:IS1/IS1595 family N-terminal zinc-binding domain-containing protein n=1 Tax=Clostridium sp. UBA1652 TaxID=1946348 RepID=UPI00257C9A55|nr:hypothetical protein [Clostridium sp. UBA1652]